MDMDDSSYSAVMSKLHFLVYGETQHYPPIDTSRYLKDMENAFNGIPAFRNLSKKYKLEDLSLNENRLTAEDITTKYLYLYIFLELMYDRIKSSKAEKEKLYNRINNIGDDNNFFGYLKIYTVYYGTRFTKWFDNPLCLRFLSSKFLMLNIAEAVVDDLVRLHFANAFVGMYVALSVPRSVNNFRKDEHDNVLCNFTPKWINLYTSWNAKFTYSDSPGVDYFPRTSWCLLGSKTHGENTSDDDPDSNAWLNFRAYALFASHLLKSQKEFNDMFGLRDAPNEDVIKDWNNEDMAYIFNRDPG
jgi:hypothetical protein